MANELQAEMWENTVRFIKQIDCESVADMCWKYNKDGAVSKIEITFERPIYLTDKE